MARRVSCNSCGEERGGEIQGKDNAKYEFLKVTFSQSQPHECAEGEMDGQNGIHLARSDIPATPTCGSERVEWYRERGAEYYDTRQDGTGTKQTAGSQEDSR